MELPHPIRGAPWEEPENCFQQGNLGGTGAVPSIQHFPAVAGCAHIWWGPQAQLQPRDFELQLCPAHPQGSRLETAKGSIGAKSPSKPHVHISPLPGSLLSHKTDPRSAAKTMPVFLAEQDSGVTLQRLLVLQFVPFKQRRKEKYLLRDQQIRRRDSVYSSTTTCSRASSVLSQKLRSIRSSLLHHDSGSAPYNSAGRFGDAAWCLAQGQSC